MSEPITIEIEVIGGMVQSVKAPAGVIVKVNDYDVDGGDDERLLTDADGEKYSQEIHEGILRDARPRGALLRMRAVAVGTKQSNFRERTKKKVGLLRGRACHRAALRADPLARNDGEGCTSSS